MAETAAEKLRRLAEEQRRAAELQRRARRMLGGGGRTYEERKAKEAARNREQSLSGRDIGPIPAVVSPSRRAEAESSFRRFCETYFAHNFPLAFSADHLRMIGKIESAVLHGGLFAMAMPRGSGKTTLCEVACLWAVLTGHRDFVALIGSNEEHAAGMLESVKVELETNDLLLEDFPEACFPIERLEGIAQRANGQLCQGERTHVEWGVKQIVLPSVPGSRASGAIIRVAGLTGQIRGMKFKRPDGRSVRPSLVIVDDPQTDESARSPSQCRTREDLLAGAILGLAGPGRKIAGVMPCTVIRPGDMADAILDRERHPEWQGERTRMVYEWPKAEAMWTKYAEILRDSLRNDGRGEQATAYYAANRAAMDEGAVIAWPERFNPDELSAIQHAMNLRIRDERAFFAEYQNEPMPEVEEETTLPAEEIAGRTNGLDRGIVPIGSTHLTTFIDVQQKVLFWATLAWADDFTGAIVDYGAFPDPKSDNYTLSDIKRTLSHLAPKAGIEGAILNGLEKLCGEQLERSFRVEGGGTMRVSRCLIDANWGTSTDVVYQFCARSQWSNVVSPAHGRYVGAASQPWSEYRKKKGDRIGTHWRIPGVFGRRSVRHVLFDSNWWKSFVHQRLGVSPGDPGALTMWGDSAPRHRMLADHLTSEARISVEARGRKVDEWRLKAPGRDNHWLDCVVGAAVAASMLGVSLPGVSGVREVPRSRERVRLSEIQRGNR